MGVQSIQSVAQSTTRVWVLRQRLDGHGFTMPLNGRLLTPRLTNTIIASATENNKNQREDEADASCYDKYLWAHLSRYGSFPFLLCRPTALSWNENKLVEIATECGWSGGWWKSLVELRKRTLCPKWEKRGVEKILNTYHWQRDRGNNFPPGNLLPLDHKPSSCGVISTSTHGEDEITRTCNKSLILTWILSRE